jgi:hypothetical protein
VLIIPRNSRQAWHRLVHCHGTFYPGHGGQERLEEVIAGKDTEITLPDDDLLLLRILYHYPFYPNCCLHGTHAFFFFFTF